MCISNHRVGSDNVISESEPLENGKIENHSNGNGNAKSSDAELESNNNFCKYTLTT